MKTKELISDVRGKASTHHPIHIDGTEVLLSLIGTLNCSNNQILRRPRLQTSCCTIESVPTNCTTVRYRNYWEPEVVAENLPRLLTAPLERHFLLLETSTESTTSITNDSNLQTVCFPSCPPEGATGATGTSFYPSAVSLLDSAHAHVHTLPDIHQGLV